jgi:hypothetical protein
MHAPECGARERCVHAMTQHICSAHARAVLQLGTSMRLTTSMQRAAARQRELKQLGRVCVCVQACGVQLASSVLQLGSVNSASRQHLRCVRARVRLASSYMAATTYLAATGQAAAT